MKGWFLRTEAAGKFVLNIRRRFLPKFPRAQDPPLSAPLGGLGHGELKSLWTKSLVIATPGAARRIAAQSGHRIACSLQIVQHIPAASQELRQLRAYGAKGAMGQKVRAHCCAPIVGISLWESRMHTFERHICHDAQTYMRPCTFERHDAQTYIHLSVI